MKKFKFFVFIILFLLVVCSCTQEAREEYDIVIYGGTFAGCAAAQMAAQLSPRSSILVIVPSPVPVLGGIGTAAGQNFFDLRFWRNQLVTGGSFARWYQQAGQFYNTQKMAEILRSDLARYENISILWGFDLWEGQKKSTPFGYGIDKNRQADHPGKSLGEGDLFSFQITALRVRNIYQDERGAACWGKEKRKITGRVFIDASDDGRLTRLAGGKVTAGRADWPDAFLENSERGEGGLPRQQAATLMFKVTNVMFPPAPRAVGDLIFLHDGYGSRGIIGGGDTYRNNPVVVVFNDQYMSRGFALKPLNAAQDGANSKEWWVNALLIFDVDGRACQRDLGSKRYPKDKRWDALDIDEAWRKAREFVARPEFIHAFRQFSATDEQGRRYGFHLAELVEDGSGRPVVGDMLYLRETVHLQRNQPGEMSPREAEEYFFTPFVDPGGEFVFEEVTQRNPAPYSGEFTPQVSGDLKDGLENIGYALTADECQFAGTSPTDGADQDNYATRIGLACYLMDINGYTPGDLKRGGFYQWPVTGNSRPDWLAKGGQPINPVYLPFEMLITPHLVNLLAPGYATGASSFAWTEVRVIPNLCVLGDAAGAAAARAVLFGEYPAYFQQEQIKWVQEALLKTGARLDK